MANPSGNNMFEMACLIMFACSHTKHFLVLLHLQLQLTWIWSCRRSWKINSSLNCKERWLHIRLRLTWSFLTVLRRYISWMTPTLLTKMCRWNVGSKRTQILKPSSISYWNQTLGQMQLWQADQKPGLNLYPHSVSQSSLIMWFPLLTCSPVHLYKTLVDLDNAVRNQASM